MGKNKEMVVPISISVLLLMQLLVQGAASDITTDTSLNEDEFNLTKMYLRDVEISPPYKDLNTTTGIQGTLDNWTVEEPGMYTFAHSWATSPMLANISVSGIWNFTIHVEKPNNTSFNPLLRADIYNFDGADEKLIHQGMTNISIDQPGIAEYNWSDDVPAPAVVQTGDRIVVKFVLDASHAPDVEYMDQPDELTMVLGNVTDYPENAGKGDSFTLNESTGQSVNETRYFRGIQNETGVNNFTAYRLGTEQSENVQQSDSMMTGGDFHAWGFRAWARHEDGNETELTPGHAVGVVLRSEADEGYQINTWDCPETPLSSTDSVVVRLYQDRVVYPPEMFVAEFTTEQLGASQLDASEWSIHYYTHRGGADFNGVYWGDHDHSTRIEGFQWITAQDEGYGLDARMEVRNVPMAETHILEYKIDTDQPEFQLLISDNGGVTYDMPLQDEVYAGEFSRVLDLSEISDGTVHLQIRDKGINDTPQNSVDIDYIRVRTYDNISLYWDYPEEEYASYLEFSIDTLEPSLDYISIVDGPAGDNITDQSVHIGSSIIGHAAGFNMTYGYLGDIYVNWNVENMGDASAYTIPKEGYNSTFFANVTSGTAHWYASYFNEGAWYNDSVTFSIYDPPPPEITNVSAVPPVQSAGEPINISSDITSYLGLADVRINITYPDGTYHNASMNSGIGDKWYLNNIYGASGIYTYSIQAVDLDGRWDDSRGHTFAVEPAEANHFVFDAIHSPQIVGEAFQINISAYDEHGNLATGYSGIAELIDTTGTLQPLNTTSFFEGNWSGEVSISHPQNNATITATDSEDDLLTGVSNEFDVVPLEGDHIVVSPQDHTLTAGESVSYTAVLYDKYGNEIDDVTADTTWSIDEDADGTWEANEYTSESTGTWTVTADYDDFTDSVNLIVEPAVSDHMVVSPQDHTLTAGESVSYTAVLYDEYGNEIDDVTADTTWSIDEDADGTWEANEYTSETAGTWTVTADYESILQTVEITVLSAGVSQVLIYPDIDQTITAGETVHFNAEALDEFDNLITSLDTDFIWRNTDSTGSFSETAIGEYYVTASYEDITSSVVTVTVEPGEAVFMNITPNNATVQAGSIQEYYVDAYDEYGNKFNVTDYTAFTIDSGAKGAWFDNIYSSEIASTWNVTGFYRTLTDTVTLTVRPPSVDYIEISPPSYNLTAGDSLGYNATAYDEFGNRIGDVTLYTVWNIDEKAGGTWVGNEYTAEVAGSWIVNGTYGDSYSSAVLLVEHGPVSDIGITPQNMTIVAGATVEYSAISLDEFGNPIDDLTNEVLWNIESGAEGRWSDNFYTSWSTGTWTVTASMHPYSDTALLHVESTDLDPTKFEIFTISGDGQEQTAGTRLEEPLVVEVRDEFGTPVGMGWKVYFNITTTGLNGDGRLSEESPLLTDEDGRAKVWLTLDSDRGENNVTAGLSDTDESKQTVFTALGTLPEIGVELSIDVDRATPGDIIVYRLQIDNVGTEISSDLWLAFQMDEKLSYVSDTSDVEPSEFEGFYTWYLTDIDVGIHRFEIVCRVSEEVRDKQVINTYFTLEYTDSRGNVMPSVVSNDVSLEIDAPLLDKIYWPWPLIPIILLIIGAAWLVFKRVYIQDVFLIHESGMLLAQRSSHHESGMDDDLFSSMLTAIQDFIRDSFKEEENYGIKRLEFGNKKILVEKGKYTFIAVVYRGRVVSSVEQKMQLVLKKIEEDYEDDLRNWLGDIDSVEGIDVYLEKLF
ncbi:MAG: hypothetical protein R6U17_02930 [Thermoplasmata archaeon]